MKTAVAPLVTLLNTATRIDYCDLYTITLLGGTVLRYTDHDQAITFDSQTYAIGPLLKRTRTKLSVGISLDTMDITLSAPATVTVNGVPMLAFIGAGGLDGARWRVERLFTANWATPPAGTLIMFAGRTGDVTLGRHEAMLTIKSDLELLDVPVPKNVYSPGCNNTVFDRACGLSRGTYTVSNAVTASPTPTKYAFDTTLAQATGYFDLGVVSFTSGANAGVSRTIKSFVGGGLVTVIAPLPFAPTSGDTFTIYPGCDKTQSTCSSKFSNLIRFRGMPYVPVPETAV